MAGFPMIDDRTSRRGFLLGAGGFALAGALSGPSAAFAQALRATPAVPEFGDLASLYAGRADGGHQLPAIPYQKIDRRYHRQVVVSPSLAPAGTIIVDANSKFLYLQLGNGKAIRYGVSLGKAGFDWTGSAIVQYKKAWPVWTPPPEMIRRKPELAKHAGGMPPGPPSPLGARALYLFKNGRDTMYRIHGTPDWDSIGRNASSGCVRMLNQDVIDLFARVEKAAPVDVVHSMYLGADVARKPASNGMAEAIDAGVPDGAEKME